jgi:hypothetical protein
MHQVLDYFQKDGKNSGTDHEQLLICEQLTGVTAEKFYGK